MLHNEARELLVEAYEKTENAKEVAKCFSVDTSTVYRLNRQKKATGSVKLRTNQRGRKPSLTPTYLSKIDQAIQEQPDITIDEIIEKLNLHVVNETVRKAVIKWGTFIKRNLFTLQSVNAPDVREKGKKWTKNLPNYDIEKLVFLDESGVNTIRRLQNDT